VRGGLVYQCGRCNITNGSLDEATSTRVPATPPGWRWAFDALLCTKCAEAVDAFIDSKPNAPHAPKGD
jgi:hypothetical protein